MIILPDKIYLTAMNKRRNISYVESPGKLILIEHPNHEIVLYGKNYSKRAALHLLTRWVKLNAYHHLNALLIKLNRRVKVKYKKLIVRSQVAQWGSYSENKNISLNYKLIFLPPALVNYAILHELCHARYFAHSPEFWAELEKFDKNWKKNKKELYDADDYIPEWVLF